MHGYYVFKEHFRVNLSQSTILTNKTA